MLAFIRSCLFSTGYAAFTITYGTLSIFVWLFPPFVRHRIISSWTTVIITWLSIACGIRYKLIGRENIPEKSGFMVLSKHQSTWETFYLQSLFWPSATVLKKELLRIPFFGWGLRAMQPIGIDRSNPRLALKQVKEEGTKRIQSGLNLILFPEGTRMAPGERGNYARSGADIAINANAQVIPVAHNAGKCWPPKSFVKYNGEITISIGPAISIEGKSSKEVIKEVETWIENEMEKIDP